MTDIKQHYKPYRIIASRWGESFRVGYKKTEEPPELLEQVFNTDEEAQRAADILNKHKSK